MKISSILVIQVHKLILQEILQELNALLQQQDITLEERMSQKHYVPYYV